jgi:hypothetical protein
LVPPIVGDVFRASGGERLDRATRADMEGHFGADFGDVRVHTDVPAAASARAIDAVAYTVGHDIVFSQSHYSLGSQAGRRLIAHELAHVRATTWQSAGSGPPDTGCPADSAAEQEAQAAGDSVVAGAGVVPIRAGGSGTIQRDRGSPGGGCGLCFGNLGDVGTLAHEIVEVSSPAPMAAS